MFADTFHQKRADAVIELARRRAELAGQDFVTRIDDSPYGGYRVRSVPADFFVDQIADGPSPFFGGLKRRALDPMS